MSAGCLGSLIMISARFLVLEVLEGGQGGTSDFFQLSELCV